VRHGYTGALDAAQRISKQMTQLSERTVSRHVPREVHVMNLLTLNTIKRALEKEQGKICAHIKKVQAENRTGGIEAKFAKAFEAELAGTKIEHERPLDVIEADNYNPDHTAGNLDCYLPDMATAFDPTFAPLHT
jgi:hypothetical protein